MEKIHLEQLLHQYLTGDITDTDRRELEALVIDDKNPEAVTEALRALLETMEGSHAIIPSGWHDMAKAITAIDKQPVLHVLPPQRTPLLRRWWAAASIALFIGIGTYIWINPKKDSETIVVTKNIMDIAPGSNGAILTLADGEQIALDSLNSGLVASQNGADVVLENGMLSYTPSGKSTGGVAYNTITTPKGRQLVVTLPDGTKAWLNAASSIRYPTVFNNEERKVTLTGEVYLEVAANKRKPFFVTTGDMEVQVLGTSFNINAYSDEPSIKTTLLNGSIKVIKPTQAPSGIILKPGEQVVFDEKVTINRTVDLEQAVSWKNGVFNFNGATLEEFLRQIARWYDLEIIYQGAIPHRIFKGEMGRDLQLSQIMKLLKHSNIKYKREGNRITIEPQ